MFFRDLERISDAVRRGNPVSVSRELELLDRQTAPFRHQLQVRTGTWKAHIHNRTLIKALSFLSDAAYLRGNFVKALGYSRPITHYLASKLLPTRERVTDADDFRLRRQQVWLVLCHAAACIRVGEIHPARELLVSARQYVSHCLEAPGFPCFGTRARIEFYLGLLARNSGNLSEARRCFDRSTEAAVARCEHAMARPGKDAAYRESERLFKKRCLARLQAFGYGLTAFAEGKLLAARASFYFALELLLDPASDGSSYHDPLMANQVRLWLILVRTTLIAFDDDGLLQLSAMRAEAEEVESWFLRQPGDFAPDRTLAAATLDFIDLRLRQIPGRHQQSASAAPRLAPPVAVRTDHWETDLTSLITNVVRIWIAIDSDLDQVSQWLTAIQLEHVGIRFWHHEVRLAAIEARIATCALQIGGPEAAAPGLEQKLLEAVDEAESLRPYLTPGQVLFAEALKARAYFELARLCRILDPAPVSSRAAHWRQCCASIVADLRKQRVLSGILKWKIASLPDVGPLARLPLPDQVKYQSPSIELDELIAGRNAIVREIAACPGLDRASMTRHLAAKLRIKPTGLRRYFDTFEELRPWLSPKGPDRKSKERDLRLVNDYLAHIRQWERSGTGT